jgi:hypothetical protein
MVLLHLLRIQQTLPSTCCRVHYPLPSNIELKAAALEHVKLCPPGLQMLFQLHHDVLIEGDGFGKLGLEWK